MNHYLIAIYKGGLQDKCLNNPIVRTKISSLGLSIHSITISNPINLTLLVGKENSQLTTELTDKYYLLTKVLQSLDDQENYYYVYDYKGRKVVENPNQCCHTLTEINIPIYKLQNVIQNVKDAKQNVFAGFNVKYLDGMENLSVEILLSSFLLEKIDKGINIDDYSSDNHYLYLQELSNSLSNPELCNFVQKSAMPVISLFVSNNQKKVRALIEVKKADRQHIEGIIKVCSDGYRATYINTHSLDYIERIINEFYNYDRVRNDVLHSSDVWNGYFVALESNRVVGAIGGGLIDKDKGEVFVLYLDPNRRGEGIGTQLLQVLTELQKSKGATQQWVSVSKGNMKGIPFYEAKGFQFIKEQDSFDNTESEEYISLRYCRKI